ncbi:Protein NRT1/ PTR FAMILY 4.6 [Dirofilaria immitis]
MTNQQWPLVMLMMLMNIDNDCIIIYERKASKQEEKINMILKIKQHRRVKRNWDKVKNTSFRIWNQNV